MQRDYRILLIEQNAGQCQDLHIILDFLNEPHEVISLTAFQTRELKMEDVLAIILLDTLPEDEIKKIMVQLGKSAPQMPVIIAGQCIFEEAAHKEQIIGQWSRPWQQAQLVSLLHHCQLNYEVRKATLHPTQCTVQLFRSLVGSSSVIRQVRAVLNQAAGSDVNVLILGESGTGKEVVARNLHYHSNRRQKPFVPINCGAVPHDLLESELFGHEKGAFTGALTARQGRFELAQGGTLFLDEIGDMPLAMQVKLLRVLEERTFERVGSNKSIKADVRIVAATHRNLEQAIGSGQFREDLYYRLNVFPIEMPALRVRREDIPCLLNELIARLEGEKRGSLRFLPAALQALSQYEWPGNVRELANLVERLAVLYPYGVIDVADLPPKFRPQISSLDDQLTKNDSIDRESHLSLNPLPKQGIDLKEHLNRTELALIKQALAEAGGVVARAADYLCMRRTTLVEKMRKFGLKAEQGVD